jgi:hypothetical protein
MMRAIMSKAAVNDTTAASHSKTLAEMLAYVARVVGSEDQAKRELHAVLKRGGGGIYTMSERIVINVGRYRQGEWEWQRPYEEYNEIIDEELWIRSDIGPDDWETGVYWSNSVLRSSIQRNTIETSGIPSFLNIGGLHFDACCLSIAQ